MAYNNSVLSQLLKLLPRHEFERLANRYDGKRRSDALSRWSQFVALTIGQLGGRRSLRDIESKDNWGQCRNYWAREFSGVFTLTPNICV